MKFDRFFVTFVLCMMLCLHHVPVFTAGTCKIAARDCTVNSRDGIGMHLLVHDVASDPIRWRLVAELLLKVGVAVCSPENHPPKFTVER